MLLKLVKPHRLRDVYLEGVIRLNWGRLEGVAKRRRELITLLRELNSSRLVSEGEDQLTCLFIPDSYEYELSHWGCGSRESGHLGP